MDFNLFMNDVVDVARKDITAAGYEELTNPEDVEQALTRKGTTLVMINSVCGCAGGVARPAAANAIHYDKRPDHLVTVFAGQDREATEKARTFFGDYPPSSPSFAFLKDGKIVTMLERHDIEGFSAMDVVGKLQNIFEEHCEEI
ncbi:BrxA/BrxB family bacilliredoxin [Virgibacillus alimentarius]|uniref:YphP/YqiW family bacilliredoxin n=1 Tax=Virgibacillus alimentarius TaxID=698769 RepID=A0ABS4S4N5_9BACI|nr:MULTISPECIES: BrxA/BrxB family bacilliredoxin [Virgibacillus]MBP2256452.1 putative YphP/YqiW family bacilliredoxin [Virgibacillus alimentarius]HLR66397.1 BrxA/BrxB family bacilliredoxin [Virgibacillus sp.]